MGRIGSEVIISTETDGDDEIQIMASPGVWVLAYQGVPVQIKINHFTHRGMVYKYPRTGFNNRAHCENLSERMNIQFDTDEFSCMQLLINSATEKE